VRLTSAAAGALAAGERLFQKSRVMNRNLLITPRWELLGLALLLAAYIAADALFDRAGYEFMNFVGPIWFASVLSFSAFLMTRADPATLWTALFWFRASSAAYFGFGEIVPLIASAERRAYMQAFFRFFSEDMAKANLIFVFSVLVVLLVANGCLLAIGSDRENPQTRHSGGAMFAAGLLFIGVGAAIKYLLVVPHLFGLTDFVLPGAVGTLGRLTLAGIFLLTAWSRAHARSMLPLIISFVALEMLIGVLAFNKTELLSTLLMFLLGFMWPRPTFVRLAVAAFLIVLTYTSVVPIVNSGRAELWNKYGSLGEADFSERLDILVRAKDAPADPTASRGLTRLSYTNQATFAVHEYDSLRPGSSFIYVLAVFVPRALWPDKPIITQVGKDFNASATGNEYSSSSPGLFAEAYWNFGWPGVVLVMAALGAILAVFSRYTLWVIHSGLWFYFPVVLIALRMGFRTDGFFVGDIAGASVLAVALHVLLTPLHRALVSGKRRRPLEANGVGHLPRRGRAHAMRPAPMTMRG